MLHKAILVCVAGLLLVTPAQARMKKPGLLTGLCKCTCSLDNGKAQDGIYDPKGGSCTVLDRKVCNITEPGGQKKGDVPVRPSRQWRSGQKEEGAQSPPLPLGLGSLKAH
jgi:hypothetical protein